MGHGFKNKDRIHLDIEFKSKLYIGHLAPRNPNTGIWEYPVKPKGLFFVKNQPNIFSPVLVTYSGVIFCINLSKRKQSSYPMAPRPLRPPLL